MATVSRRCQSYSDFHDAARAVLESNISKQKDVGQPKERGDIKDELDFIDWYHDLEDDLLDASHDEYMLAQHILNAFPSALILISLSDPIRTSWTYQNLI